jgi:hypothetical protein
MLWRNREGRQVATITGWLASLGLPEYAQRFAENGIDVSVLRYLTDQDLEKIGVLLGHRRKMTFRHSYSAARWPGAGQRMAAFSCWRYASSQSSLSSA